MATRPMNSTPLALGGVPVLMYHDLCHDLAAADRYALSAAAFDAQLNLLREQQIAVVDLPALRTASSGPRVVITFDDGLVRQFDLAMPELAAHAMSATFFVTTSLIGTPGYLSWSQLRVMSAAGMTIGSHGDRHIAYTALTMQFAANELTRSRQTLEDGLGCAAEAFSAPFGFINGAVVAAAHAAGFRFICSSRPWPARPGDRDIPRLVIYHNTSLAEYSALVTGRPLPILARRTRDALLHLPKQWMLRSRSPRLGLDPGEVEQ